MFSFSTTLKFHNPFTIDTHVRGIHPNAKKYYRTCIRDYILMDTREGVIVKTPIMMEGGEEVPEVVNWAWKEDSTFIGFAAVLTNVPEH
jgi:hypothetical protein